MAHAIPSHEELERIATECAKASYDMDFGYDTKENVAKRTALLNEMIRLVDEYDTGSLCRMINIFANKLQESVYSYGDY
jgi:hypothetical protein